MVSDHTHLQESHSLEAPHGYLFIAAGDPELTAQCKEFARLEGCTVYVVSVTILRLLQ